MSLLGEEFYDGATWDQLLECRRVLLLAEGGSGKSREMQAAADRLVARGEVAFFLPIETLADQDLAGVLGDEPGALDRFDGWKRDGGKTAWFFLDAVDELKLTQGKLDRALARAAAGIGPASERARFVISCRPTDWRPVEDREIVERRLPPLAPPQPPREFEDDEFLGVFRKRGAAKAEELEPPKPDRLRTVVLLPLSEKQIRTFAEERGVPKAGTLLAEIARHEAIAFARRPLDLDNMIAVWMKNGRLGTRLEQHQVDVENGLRDDPGRPDASILSRAKLQEGVERLALAMTLMAVRAIRSPEQAIAQDRETQALNAADILDDWTPAQVAALLRRPIFDPATYGRARFHHRSVQEYLAARRLKALRGAGMSSRQLHRLLFSELYGERVVIPSMAPIAAWLAHDETEVRTELLLREPEILLLHGDPEALPLDARTDLLRFYVNAYSGGGWRGLHMPIGEVRRLAHPDLAGEIRRCWASERTNNEIDRLLLKLIWLGPVPACADIACSAAFDVKRDSFERIIAIRALGEMKLREDMRAVVGSIFANPGAWPDRIVQTTIDDLFPQVMSIAELEKLATTLPEPRDRTSGFGWSLYSLAEAIDPDSGPADELRDLLARLVWDGRDEKLTWHQPRSRFRHFTPALFRLCARQLRGARPASRQLFHACAVAERFHGRESLGGDARAQMDELLKEGSPDLRRAAFIEDLHLADALAGEVENYKRSFMFSRWGLVKLTPADWPWLIDLARDNEGTDPLIVAECLIRIFVDRGRPPEDLAELTRAMANDANASKLLADFLTPRQATAEWIAHQEQMAAIEAEHDAEDDRRLANWSAWRERLLADVPAAFVVGRLRKTLLSLTNWLLERPDGRNTIATSNWRDVRRVLGDAVGDAYEDALCVFWRSAPPPVPWLRPELERSGISLAMMLGLTGLQIETYRNPEWPRLASAEEAKRATGWATIENSQPEWLPALAAAHPAPVTSVLEDGIGTELDNDEQHPRGMSLVEHGDISLKRLLAPFLKKRVLAWSTTGTQDEFQQHARARNLARAVSVTLQILPHDAEIAEHAARQFESDPTGPLAFQWLLATAAADLSKVPQLIADALKKPEIKRTEGIAWLTTAFGMNSRMAIPVKLDAGADTLLALVRLCYRLIRREEDVLREGVYELDARDDAQTARNQVLSALIARPGPEAHDGIVALSADDAMAHLRDRLLLHARERAAEDSAPAPLTQEQFRQLDRTNEAPPGTAHQLFDVLLDRLDDVAFDLQHHDMNERPAWRQLTQEKDLQPLLARKLLDAARNAYRTSREEEVVGGNVTDIRLAATAFEGRVVIEMKVGDNWTIRELEAAISDQLVAKYLQHPSCAGGCLLVTYAGRKGFRCPDNQKDVTFEELITRLKAKAAEIETRERGRIRLAVVGLDLR